MITVASLREMLPPFTRSLRFRLTVSYIVLFTALLVVLGMVFRSVLKAETEGQVGDLLEEQWGAAKGYLRIENERPFWFADFTDPEEADIVARLRYVLLLTDEQGNVLLDSPIYRSIGIDSLEEIRRIIKNGPNVHIRYNDTGVPYLIKAGPMPDEHRKNRYFFAIGRSLEASEKTVTQFTQTYFLFLPVMIALTGVLGWWLAGRAIQPVNSVAQAAQSITGSNLTLSIPLRDAGDELDNLIDNFNRMTVRLAQSFEQIRQFSTDVSHELRTPLTAIRGQLEVALFTAETQEQYREAVVNALEAVEQLSSIVRQLLLLSQAESGQLALQKTTIDLGALVTDITDQFQIPAEEKEITLIADVAPVKVAADRTQIERLVSNLLSNALKYTPVGGSVSVRVSANPIDQTACLVVEDTGVGIPPENLPHIFNRFYRVRNPQTNQIEGLGLGLSFVSWIVTAHGGKIDVSSSVGKGTRFTVRLPGTATSLIHVPVAQAALSETMPEERTESRVH